MCQCLTWSTVSCLALYIHDTVWSQQCQCLQQFAKWLTHKHQWTYDSPLNFDLTLACYSNCWAYGMSNHLYVLAWSNNSSDILMPVQSSSSRNEYTNSDMTGDTNDSTWITYLATQAHTRMLDLCLNVSDIIFIAQCGISSEVSHESIDSWRQPVCELP